MSDRYIKCGRCGKINPASARICLDCNTILEYKAAPGMEHNSGAQLKPETGFDQIESFYDDQSPLKAPEDLQPLKDVERIQQDRSAEDGAKMEGIQRIGDEIVDQDEGSIEKSRAFEIDSSSYSEDPADQDEFRMSGNLETFEEATERMKGELESFQQVAREQSGKTAEYGALDTSARPLPEFEVVSTRPPRTADWEKTDEQILTSIRRKRTVKQIFGKTIPLTGLGLLLVLCGYFVVFPTLLPSGNWSGSLIDQTGDSKITYFGLDLNRTGNTLTGWFWLTDQQGRDHDPQIKVDIPYSLSSIYRGKPIPVTGSFSRQKIVLRIHPGVPGTPQYLDLKGNFLRADKAEGQAINNRNIKSLWSFYKN